MRRSLPALVGVAPLVGFLLLFALLPVAVLFATAWSSGGGSPGFFRALGDPLTMAALRNSVLQGSLSAGATVALGYPAGVFLGRHRFPGRDAVLALFSVPFLLPSLVVVEGVEDLFGPAGVLTSVAPAVTPLGTGLGGVLVVNVCFNLPLVALLTAVAVEGADPQREEAVAVLGGSPARAYLEGWGPASWVGAGAGALLTFLFSAMAFAAPLVVCGPRCYTLEARIFTLDQQLVEPAAAGLVALAAVGLLAVPALAYLSMVTRLTGPGRPGPRPGRPVRWRDPTAVGLAAATAAVVALIVAVAAAITWRAIRPGPAEGLDLWSPELGQRLGFTTVSALGNTLFYAAGAALLAVLLGILAGYVLRSAPRSEPALRFLLFLPLLVSPVILSFALAGYWRPVLGGESTVWLLIVLSQATLALPFASQSLFLGLSGLPRSIGESARTLGARPVSAFMDTELPLARAAILSAALFAFALGLGEFTATYFLATPRFATWTVELYHLQATREYTAAAQLALALLAFSFVSLLGLLTAGRRVRA